MSEEPTTLGQQLGTEAKAAGYSDEPTCYPPFVEALEPLSADDKTALVGGWRAAWS